MIPWETAVRMLVVSVLICGAVMPPMTIEADSKSPQPVYVSPAQFSELPNEFRQELLAEGCTIPQTVYSVSTNVIHAQFADKGQLDWAVLCSIKGESHIRIFWGGDAHCPSRLAIEPDRNFLLKNHRGEPEFWRAIEVFDAERVITHYRAHKLTGFLSPEHDSINDAFVEKGSIIHYCRAGQWIEIPGAD